MDLLTLKRCGFVWLVLALFLLDGTSLIRAGECRRQAESNSPKEIKGRKETLPDSSFADLTGTEDPEILLVDTTDSTCLSKEEALRDNQTRKRLLNGGLFAGSLLVLLGLALGYLKLETATRGFYSRRLQTASAVVAIAVIATALWFSQIVN